MFVNSAPPAILDLPPWTAGLNCRVLPVAYCLLVLLAGCPGPESDGNRSTAEKPLAGVKLRLLVADDPELAAAAGLLQGEWNAQTGSEFQVESTTKRQLADADALAADAVICPLYLLGTLAERNLVVPIPEKLLPKKLLGRAGGDWSGIFELLKLREAAWGQQIQAVPFGSPVLTCYYRADLLEKLGRRPPRTWAEYHQLAELLAAQKDLGANAPWSGTIEPLGPGWAGLVLLARAAPYAKHRDNYSTLFDIRTIGPLVAGEPFVRALEELVAAARLGPKNQLEFDPTSVRAAFWQGECGMALTWPTAATGGLPADAVEDIEVGFAELPGSAEVFNVGNQSWESRTENADKRVPLLAVAGRIGVVSSRSAHPEPAFQLLFWLSGKQFSPQVCTRSPATTLFRRSHLEAPQQWTERPISPAAAAAYGALTEATLLHQQWLFAPRIPGRREYLSALDAAVHQAIRGEQSPADALARAAARWREITKQRGAERQKAAYLHSLGLE